MCPVKERERETCLGEVEKVKVINHEMLVQSGLNQMLKLRPDSFLFFSCFLSDLSLYSLSLSLLK